MSGNRFFWLTMGSGLMLTLMAVSVADHHDLKARQRLENTPCGSLTIGRSLEQLSQIHSRRDLGWRYYPGNGYVDVERAFRVSKSMVVRYGWRVTEMNQVIAITPSALNLCENASQSAP